MQVRLHVTRAMLADASRSSSIRHRRLQRILVPLLLLAGSLGGVLVAASPASATVGPITHPTGFPVATSGDTEGSSASTSVTMPHLYGSIGDLAVLLGHYNSSTNTITGITGTQSGTWTLRFRQVNDTLTKTTDIWTAPVTATGSADVLTITYSGSMDGISSNYWPDSITAGLGAHTVWSFSAVASTNDITGSATAIDYPSLTSATTTNPQAYLGVVASTVTATGGSTSGFSYIDSTISGNEMVYDLSLLTNTAYAPTSTQTPAGSYLTAGIIIEAAAAYTVTFNANGGTGTMATETHNVPTALTTNAFTRTGYTFNDWNTVAGGTGTSYTDGASYPFTASVTLYAQWTGTSYTVTFNANGGTGTMATETHNVPTALTTNAFTRTGYTFNDWNTVAGGTGTSYANGASYPFTASVTLYAQWTGTSYTVTFNANGGTGTMATETHTVPTPLTANAFTRTGYTFNDWNTVAGGTGTSYANGATYVLTASGTLYAQWTGTS